MAKRLSKKHDGFWINQYSNPENPNAHYKTTGQEIYDQMGGNLDYVFIGVGTGGTISGIAKYLKQKNPEIQIIGKFTKFKKN